MNTTSLATAAALLLATANASNALTAVVTSETEYLNTVGNVVSVEELFLDDIAGASSIVFDSGVESNAVGGNPAFFGDNSVFEDTAFGDGDGEWFTGVGPGSSVPTSVTWVFPFEIVGFFASWESVTFVQFDVLDTGGSVLDTVRFDQFLPNPPNAAIDGFLGYVNTDTPFSQIRYEAVPRVSGDFFSVNSFQFTDGTPLPDLSPPDTSTAVPLPSAGLLLLSGAAPIAMFLRRRRNKAA